jgi:hypothetical protein
VTKEGDAVVGHKDLSRLRLEDYDNLKPGASRTPGVLLQESSAGRGGRGQVVTSTDDLVLEER